MNVVVRNTFLHLSLEGDLEDDHRSQRSLRSCSEPPSCRHLKFVSADRESDGSTRCHTAIASSFGDLGDDMSPASSNESKRNVSDVDDGCRNDCAVAPPGPSSDGPAVYPEYAQQQIEQMSDKVMDIWSKLRALEMNATAELPSNDSPAVEVSPSISDYPVEVSPDSGSAAAWMPLPTSLMTTQCVPCQEPLSPTAWAPLKAPKLDSKAPPFTPSCKVDGNAQDVLTSVKQILMRVPGIADVKLHFPAEGTLATVTIKRDSDAQKIPTVINNAKNVLLEAAAKSRDTYVLGYEAQPFKDLDNSAFLCMLSSLPDAWQRTACWETFQTGTCPRRKYCKWQHPGKKELQPVRVAVS